MEEREAEILIEIEAKLNKELKYLGIKEKDQQNHISNIQEFQIEWNKLAEQSDEKVLLEAESKFKKAEIALSDPKTVKLNTVFTKVQRESEFAQFSKHLISSLNQVQSFQHTNQTGL